MAARLARSCCLLTWVAVALASAAWGCTDRERPTPVDPSGGLSVDVLVPTDNQSFHPGPLDIRVHGHDLVGRLTALGAVLQSAAIPGGFADSAFIHFPPTADTTVTVRILLPFVTQPVGIELRGEAQNALGGSTLTGLHAINLLPCPINGCPGSASVVAADTVMVERR